MRILLFFLVVGFVSCQNENKKEAYHSFNNNTWNTDSIVSFEFDNIDTTSSHDLYLMVRHTTNFKFQNLFLFTNFENQQDLTFLSKCIYAQQSFPKNGVDENFKPIYAFTNANIIISPNQELKKSTLLIQDNIIIVVDSNLSIPQDAIVYDLEGDYIYRSFIDLYSNYCLLLESN